MLIQSDAGVKALHADGGYLTQLPKDTPISGWTFYAMGGQQHLLLVSVNVPTDLTIIIECHGLNRADSILLAAAISKVLNGFVGNLPDSDTTFVAYCSQGDILDEFDDANRTFCRKLELNFLFTPSGSK